MYLSVTILDNGHHLGFSIGQSDRMDFITIEMSHADVGVCITICTMHPNNAHYLLHCRATVIRLVAIGPSCDGSAMFAAISSGGPRGRAITNDWRKSMARAIVGNRSTTDVRSIVTAGDRLYDHSIVASCDRSYEQSWHPVTERTINRSTRRPMVRSIVGCNDRSHDQS